MEKRMIKKAQSIVEYIVLISIVALALVAMTTYIQRSANATLKMIEDQINEEPQ